MVNMDKVKRGVARYLDEEFTNKLDGWGKWVFGAGAAMYLENLDSATHNLRQNEIVKTMALIDEAGNVDVEKIYRYLKPQAQKGPVTFSLPMLGSVTLNAGDVDKLYNCIMQA